MIYMFVNYVEVTPRSASERRMAKAGVLPNSSPRIAHGQTRY